MLISEIVSGDNITEGLFLSSNLYRTVIFQRDNEKLTLPVTPWKYSVQMEQNNKVVDVLDFGEALIFGNTKLKRLKISCFLPLMKHKYNFVVGDNKEPEECITQIEKWKEGKSPVRVIITESPVNLMMGIETFDYREKDGSRDVYFDMRLVEYRDWNVPSSNYTKQIDGRTGLKTRPNEGNTTDISAWIGRAADIYEKSAIAYGDFLHVDTFKSKNSLARLSLSGVSSSISKKWSF